MCLKIDTGRAYTLSRENCIGPSIWLKATNTIFQVSVLSALYMRGISSDLYTDNLI
jgi:hypothetical protein